jgi:hypothetical protein
MVSVVGAVAELRVRAGGRESVAVRGEALRAAGNDGAGGAPRFGVPWCHMTVSRAELGASAVS